MTARTWNRSLERPLVYFIQCNAGPIKIGMTSTIWQRLNDLQTSNPFELDILGCMYCETPAEAKRLERTLHMRFKEQRLRGEWFQFSEDLATYITQHAQSFDQLKQEFVDGVDTHEFPDCYVGIEVAAALFGLSPQTLRRMFKDGAPWPIAIDVGTGERQRMRIDVRASIERAKREFKVDVLTHAVATLVAWGGIIDVSVAKNTSASASTEA